MTKETFTYDSRDGKSKISAVRWIPDGEIVCILQLVHGMAEYIDRYEEVAEYFTTKGFLVTGEDHLGHGKTVPKDGTYGYFCEQDPATVVVRDVHRLKKINQEQYPGIPYFILGHSMGSFIVRNYLFRYGTGIQGAVLSGTGLQDKLTIRMGLILERIQRFFLGSGHVAYMLDHMGFGSYNKKISEHRTKFDWVCSDDEVVDRYVKDPWCGFVFTLNGFRTLFTLLDRMTEKENLEAMPKELPIFFVAGKEDPVGNYGEGVRQTYDAFREAGMKNLSISLYEGQRHEILNEKIRFEICSEISDWIRKQIEDNT